jgi:four helix bundle protein
MHSYRKLKVWQDSIDLVDNVYELAERFSPKERYILIPQILRAAISIPSNIAEGAGRESDRDFYRFLSIAKGSAFELETQMMIVARRKYLTNEQFSLFLDRCDHVQPMLTKLQHTIIQKYSK